MKILLGAATLFAAAVCAEIFPDMKKLLLLIPFALLALTLAGCTTNIAKKLNAMPDGSFSSATLIETDKFTSTTISMAGVVKDNGEMSADSIHIDHTNPWMTKLTFDAKDYRAQLSRAANKKLLDRKPATPTPAPATPPVSPPALSPPNGPNPPPTS